MEMYELIPVDHRKSFYGKAVVACAKNGSKTLFSYGTPVIRRNSDGTLSRLWNDWSATTGRHVAAFCGINKKQWDKMEVVR